MFYAICDCDNCFVSCERVFRPDLNGKAVVVLSNNDGCVVARSKEAKSLGVKMGIPYYQMRAQYPESEVVAFSSNYELYADMTARVMSLIRKSAPAFFRYSVDEAFCILPEIPAEEAKEWGERLSATIVKYTGMPLSVGIARTKTLAKIAVRFAKKYPGYNKCAVIDTDEQRSKALDLTEIGDVWGIGRRLSSKYDRLNIKTALDFADIEYERALNSMNLTVFRTWRELNGHDCIPQEKAEPKKSILTSRSLGTTIREFATLRTHVANFAARCAEKLRAQKSVASVVGVFIVTNRFRDDVPQYGNMFDHTFATPTDSTIEIVKGAVSALKSIYKDGYGYKKAGVSLMGISDCEGVQPDLFDYSPERAERLHSLDSVVDSINRIQGRDTVITGAQQYAVPGMAVRTIRFSDAIRHDYRSPNPTTRWTDIIKLK